MRRTNFLKAIWTVLLLAGLFTPCAGAEYKELSPTELMNVNTSTTLIVDIRWPDEWSKEGLIAHSHRLTFFNAQGHFDLPNWLSKLTQLKKTKDTAIILVCASGNRSKIVAELLSTKLTMKNISHLKGGIKSWKQQGHLTTTPDSKL